MLMLGVKLKIYIIYSRKSYIWSIYRGAAHNKCNFEYQIANFIPIFFHNISAYDRHLFVRERSSIEDDISIIPLNKELYVFISKKFFIN